MAKISASCKAQAKEKNLKYGLALTLLVGEFVVLEVILKEIMFKDFNISSFKKTKPPSDNSFDTDQEIKALKKIPLRKDFVKKYDNIEKSF